MRILLDENIPVDLAAELVGHEVDTVAGAGWVGIANGRLLRRASGRYDAFVTMDRSIQHQQNIAVLSFGVILLQGFWRAADRRLVTSCYAGKTWNNAASLSPSGVSPPALTSTI